MDRGADSHPPDADRRRQRPAPPLHDHAAYLANPGATSAHELATQAAIAQRLAALLGCRFDGMVDAAGPPRPVGYAIPGHTLTSIDDAARWGIRSAADLFGGVVPHAHAATKTITHPLVDAAAVAPAGWSAAFPERVRAVVLPGYAAYSVGDARRAGHALLARGPVRVKPAAARGGNGQVLAHDGAALDAALDALAAEDVERDGVVVESHLASVRTLSVGIVHVGALVASYVGTQRTTPDRDGREVYGGSSLTVVRGGFDALQRLAAADADQSRAVALARCYHEAALVCLDPMFLSRANYDVACGIDASGRELAGVLEQSWRIGGASGAEVAALEALQADPTLAVVRASTVEVHGRCAPPPVDATIYFAGDADGIGTITKYARIDGHGHA